MKKVFRTPEEIKEIRKQHHIKNREKDNANAKKWRDAHPEQVKQMLKAWGEKNKQKILEYRSKRLKKIQAERKEYKKRNPKIIIINDYPVDGYVASYQERVIFNEKFNIPYPLKTKGRMIWKSCPKCSIPRWARMKQENSLCGKCNRANSTRVVFRNVDNKICNACEKEKPISEFFVHPRVKSDGHRGLCKECFTIQCEKWRKSNIDKIKQYMLNSYNRKRQSPKDVIRQRMSSLIGYSLRRQGKNKEGKSWKLMVPYSCKELMDHLEKLFKPGMSWINMGEWHIDHKRPISSFNFTSYCDAEFKECWSLKNLQPLWAMENMKKHNKIL